MNILKFAKYFEVLAKSEKESVPTDPRKWGRAKAEAKKRYDKWPSAYSSAFAAKKYKEWGGKWKKKKKKSSADDMNYVDSFTDQQLLNMGVDLNDVEDSEDLNDVFEGKNGLEAHGKKGGLDEWFDEKWVNICKKEDGKHPPCGRNDADKGKYPKCVPKAKANNMSKKDKDDACKRKRKSNPSKGKKPTYVSTKKDKK